MVNEEYKFMGGSDSMNTATGMPRNLCMLHGSLNGPTEVVKMGSLSRAAVLR